MKRIRLSALLGCACAVVSPMTAEEAGSAHYLPGSQASFMDAFPGKPGSLALLHCFSYYGGTSPLNLRLPMGGFLATEADATAHAESILAVYQTPWEVLGGGFAFGLNVPYVWLEVDAQAQRIGPDGVPGPVRSLRDTASGIGDLAIIPVMVGWTDLAPDLKLDFRLGVYAPTGAYRRGDLANIGKNYWTVEPGVMASWLSRKTGMELSLYSGVDFNTENHDSDYHSGSSFHVDMTAAQHLPLWGGIAGLGANAFYYRQIGADSGAGARLGDFEGMTVGVGPAVSYVRHVGSTQVFGEIKWLPELDVDRRMEGDYVWFKLGVQF